MLGLELHYFIITRFFSPTTHRTSYSECCLQHVHCLQYAHGTYIIVFDDSLLAFCNAIWCSNHLVSQLFGNLCCVTSFPSAKLGSLSGLFVIVIPWPRGSCLKYTPSALGPVALGL